ncbi:MAG: hypothetical protein CMP62_01640 [Flavobacteriales bacterium]|nr:hypothetical protein [Flavobacteriales bacterium]
MLNYCKISILILFSVFLQTIGLSQHYDIGYNTDYLNIYSPNSFDPDYRRTIFTLEPKKKIKKVFSETGALLEELVFVNGVLVGGIEYFIHSEFPFLDTPRRFRIEAVTHSLATYKNMAITSSTVRYVPDFQNTTLKVRVYNNDMQSFYILNTTPHGRKLFFKEEGT